MLYSEIIAVCSQIHKRHTNTLCRQNVELWMLYLVVRIVTTEVWSNDESVISLIPSKHKGPNYFACARFI
jgi:hypothetical protein